MDQLKMRAGMTLLIIGAIPILFALLSLWVLISNVDSTPNKTGSIIFMVIVTVLPSGAGGALIYLGWRMRKKGKRMKSIEDLTTSDFPGVDSKKFYEWYYAAIRTYKPTTTIVSTLITVPTIIIALSVGGSTGVMLIIALAVGWLLYILINVQKVRQLQKEAGIDSATLKRALEKQPDESIPYFHRMR